AKVPCGVNGLRIDGIAALAIAAAAASESIRVDVLTGARVTDQGRNQGRAHESVRERRRLGAETIQTLADVDVKHSAPLAPRPIVDEVADLVHRAGADAVVVTGRSTGAATRFEEVRQVQSAADGKPVIVGSGVNADSIDSFIGHAS